jgi:AAA domain
VRESLPPAVLVLIAHANRIEAALDRELKNRPELGAFFDYNRSERFFIKNIERVQGDERDVIILSVGYGKDRSGRLPYRFGPLLSEGGERRLNVAITRARQKLMALLGFVEKLYSMIQFLHKKPSDQEKKPQRHKGHKKDTKDTKRRRN